MLRGMYRTCFFTLVYYFKDTGFTLSPSWYRSFIAIVINHVTRVDILIKQRGDRMICIGHFSFDELGLKNDIRHGYFACLVDAESAEKAAEAFKGLILSLKKTEDMFHRISAVYLEEIVTLSHTPKNAFVTRIQSSAGPFPKSITRSLPGVVSPGISTYGFAPDVRENEAAEDTETYKTAQPFIKF